MKKNTIKAFTLVEMLIVIVIIGILIASLMPRMQSAQGRARDVARKNDLAQVQTAIITSQQDKGEWPQLDKAQTGAGVHEIETELLRAGMSSVPSDPNKSNNVSGLGKGGAAYSGGEYAYMVAKRNGVDNGGFVLMAKTEVEGGSNWVYCGSGETSGLTGGFIGGDSLDLKNITTCTKFTYNDGGSDCTTASGGTKGNCIYNDVNQLRYILLY